MMTQNSETLESTIPGIVTLVIPCQPEYVSVARLTMLGIGSRLQWSTDDLEDLRLAVAEVCIDAIDRADNYDSSARSDLTIDITASIAHDKITVDIRDHVPQSASSSVSESQTGTEGWIIHDRQSVSDALVEALVDSFERSEELSGTVVRLVKFVANTDS